MIYMTTDEWKKISKIVEEKDLKELVIELSAQTYDLNVGDIELDHLMMNYIANAKNKEEKRIWKISSFASPYSVVNYSDDIRELTETKAIEWYNEYVPKRGEKKGQPLYKKEGEWVSYEKLTK